MGSLIGVLDRQVGDAITKGGILSRSPKLFRAGSDPGDILDGSFVLLWDRDTRESMDGPNGIQWSGRLTVTVATAIDPADQLVTMGTVADRETAVADGIVPGADASCLVEVASSIEPAQRRRRVESRWIFSELEFTVVWYETIREG